MAVSDDLVKLAADLGNIRDLVSGDATRAEVLAADEVYRKLCQAGEVYPAVSLFLAGVKMTCLGLEGFIEHHREKERPE
jgi:hypothetical protein